MTCYLSEKRTVVVTSHICIQTFVVVSGHIDTLQVRFLYETFNASYSFWKKYYIFQFSVSRLQTQILIPLFIQTYYQLALKSCYRNFSPVSCLSVILLPFLSEDSCMHTCCYAYMVLGRFFIRKAEFSSCRLHTTRS